MRVALDVSAVPERVAGAGRYIVELARRLPEAGVDLTLVTRRSDAARWRHLSSAAIAPVVPDARPARLLAERVALGRSEVARRAEVWHAPHYTMPRAMATPAVVTIHDLTVFTNPEWHERAKVLVFREAIRHAARHAAALVCVSEFTRRVLDETLDVRAPVVVAPMGVDLEHFSPDGPDDAATLASHGLPAAPFIFFVGTVEPRKGLDVLLDAFAELAEADPDLELWVAGQAGWGTGEVERRFVEHRAAARIRRLGYVEDALLPVLMRRARVVAYPSRAEGVGMPVVEALACGASVVTTSATVMAELAGDAARYAGAGDAKGLSHAIAEALALGPGERALESARARRRAELYSWEVAVARHLEAYRMARGSR